MIFRVNSNKIEYWWIFAEILAEIEAQKINTPKVIASKSTPKSMFFVEIRSEMEPRKNRHAEENCIKKHAEIDDFSLKFEQKLKHEKSSRQW